MKIFIKTLSYLFIVTLFCACGKKEKIAKLEVENFPAAEVVQVDIKEEKPQAEAAKTKLADGILQELEEEENIPLTLSERYIDCSSEEACKKSLQGIHEAISILSIKDPYEYAKQFIRLSASLSVLYNFTFVSDGTVNVKDLSGLNGKNAFQVFEDAVACFGPPKEVLLKGKDRDYYLIEWEIDGQTRGFMEGLRK